MFSRFEFYEQDFHFEEPGDMEDFALDVEAVYTLS
jgi:hypothetical protein